MTNFENGTVLYRYTVKNGKFFVHEGVVNDTGFRKLVNFKDRSPTLRCPRIDEVGKIKTVGQSLWMTERDDAKARKMFIAYESKKITELNKQIDKKVDTIAILMSMDTKTLEDAEV